MIGKQLRRDNINAPKTEIKTDKCRIKIRKLPNGSIIKEISNTCTKEQIRALMNVPDDIENQP